MDTFLLKLAKVKQFVMKWTNQEKNDNSRELSLVDNNVTGTPWWLLADRLATMESPGHSLTTDLWPTYLLLAYW